MFNTVVTWTDHPNNSFRPLPKAKSLATMDFVMTIDSDAEENATTKPDNKERNIENGREDLNLDFVFDASGDPYSDALDQTEVADLVRGGTKPVGVTSISLLNSNEHKASDLCGRHNSQATVDQKAQTHSS